MDKWWLYLGRVADFIALIAVLFNTNWPLWIRIILGIMIVVTFVLSIVLKTSEEIVIKDYAIDKESKDVTSLIVANRDNMPVDMLVSIYMKHEGAIKLVAIGSLIDTTNRNEIQVEIVHYIDIDLMNKIRDNQSNIKSYFAMAKVRYSDVEELFE